MDYVFWVALGGTTTAISCGVGLIVHVVRYAYSQGETNTRLVNLEKGDGERSTLLAALASLTAELAALKAEFHSFKSSIERLDRIVERIDASGSRAARHKAPMEAA
jgi:hypothetical protein